MRLALLASLVSPIREPHCGGAQAFLADLAMGLAKRGHEVDVFAASGSAIDECCVIDVGVDASSLRAFLYRAGSSQPTVDVGPFVAAYARAFDAIRERSYDVVHNHAFDAPAIRGAIGIAAPVIHTLHLPPEGSVVDALCEASMSHHPPHIAAVSSNQADAWRRFVDVDTVIRPGVVTARIPWSETPGRGAVFAGRYSPEKGAIDAIAIARLAGMPIDLYGDAYDDDYAEREVHRADAQPGVRVHPAIPRASLWQAIGRSAAVLCPAGWDEPFGLVAAEAQACGVPVVAYRRGGLAEVILDGTTGFLVAPSDIGGAAAALGRISDLERRACRSHAEAHLDIEAVLDSHERVYRGVLAPDRSAVGG